MLLKSLMLCESPFTYEVGDTVNTPFGPGLLVGIARPDSREGDQLFVVGFSQEIVDKYDMERSTCKLTSFQFNGIIKKGNKNETINQPD